MSSIISAFLAGGTWMWVILALQLVATAIILERLYHLFVKNKIGAKDLVKSFEEPIRQGNLSDVVKSAEVMSMTQPVARAVVAGSNAAINYGGKDEIQGKMDEVLLEENEILEKRVGFLAMLANVGTLTGLLGTIVGMIKSFSAISTASAMEKATMLSTGISEAMNTTAYGLIMAIPTLIMFAVLTNRAQALSEDMNQAALKVFNWLSYSFESVGVKPRVTKRPPVEKSIESEML